MTQHERLLAGQLFNPNGDELRAAKRMAHLLSAQYNLTNEDDKQLRAEITRKILKQCGENVYFQGPIFFNYGIHTTIGNRCFANYNFCVLDDAPVTIGDHFQAGPNVTIATPMHPLVAAERHGMLDENGEEFKPCYAKPTVIGNDVWLAAGVIVCAGVTIGDGAVVGAGSVVTQDIPPNTLAAGVPCRVIRAITQADSLLNSPDILGPNRVI